MTDSPYPYEGPDELRAPILAALRRVVDPELALSIVDVGLVVGVSVLPDRVDLRLTMTSAACPVADVIVDDACTELDRVVPQDLPVNVELVWEPAWTSDRMSDRAKAFMGW
ncbi:MAG: DUF59 domain-containing protein [Comamonadaceae bacterium]|jgi:metal-sulfur cluster biosynthetic enzyme|nr:DUF59 domain-containing protein [Comamonadaceae bacterium]